MPIDARIPLQGIQPEPLINTFAKMQSIRGAQQENAMRQAQMDEYQRKLQDQNALRSTLAGFTPDMTAEQQVSALQRGGHLAEARLLAESSAKTAADQRAEEKAALEAEHKRLEIRGQVYGSVAATPTIEAAQSALKYLVDNKLADPANADTVWQQIQANPTPENIRGLAQRFQIMSLNTKDQLEKHYVTQDYGGGERVLGMPKYGTGAARVVEGSDVRTTLKPGEAERDAETRRHNLAMEGKESTKDKAPGVTSPDAARAFLASAGFDPKTGEDDVSKLIPKSTGGMLNTAGAKVAEAFNVTTSGQAALGKLASRSSKLVLDLLGGKLGAGVSNADREFMLQAVGDIGNSMLSTGKRLAAWKDLRGRMEALAGDSSGTAAPAARSPEDAQALAWANANPNDPRAAQIKQRLGAR